MAPISEAGFIPAAGVDHVLSPANVCKADAASLTWLLLCIRLISRALKLKQASNRKTVKLCEVAAGRVAEQRALQPCIGQSL